MEHSGALNSHIKKLFILLLYNRKMSKNFNDTDFQKSPINIDGADINKMFIFDDFRCVSKFEKQVDMQESLMI